MKSNSNLPASNSCLVITHGFFGDILFASSLAEKLAREYSRVDYLIGYPQVQQLLINNPYISNVLVSQHIGPQPTLPPNLLAKYSRIIPLPVLSFRVPPALEYQIYAEIKDPTPDYTVYTLAEYDDKVQELIKELQAEDKKVVAVMANWKPKTYLFTPEQYAAGIDVPNLGYGGSHRDVESILAELQKEYVLLEVGIVDRSQAQTASLPDSHPKSLLFEASVLKYCDAFIGTEGGLCNLAAGVGTRTIITGDFVHQLYGWNGVLKKIAEPKLGPVYYFPNKGHIALDPYLTDQEVALEIKRVLNENNL